MTSEPPRLLLGLRGVGRGRKGAGSAGQLSQAAPPLDSLGEVGSPGARVPQRVAPRLGRGKGLSERGKGSPAELLVDWERRPKVLPNMLSLRTNRGSSLRPPSPLPLGLALIARARPGLGLAGGSWRAGAKGFPGEAPLVLVVRAARTGGGGGNGGSRGGAVELLEPSRVAAASGREGAWGGWWTEGAGGGGSAMERKWQDWPTDTGDPRWWCAHGGRWTELKR